MRVETMPRKVIEKKLSKNTSFLMVSPVAKMMGGSMSAKKTLLENSMVLSNA